MAVLAVLLPPLAGTARGHDWAETLQFVLMAQAMPALFVLGFPFAARHARSGRGAVVRRRRLEALAKARARHRSLARALVFVAIDAGVVVAWRLPGPIDALARHPWLLVVELVTLVVAGIGLWVELVASPPFGPRVARPWRAVLAAISMWPIWIMAYVVGFSHVDWYPALHHVTDGFSAVADQEIACAILWFAAACTFVPVVFSDLMAWLKDDNDPDAELRRLIQSERRSGSDPGRPAGGSAA